MQPSPMGESVGSLLAGGVGIVSSRFLTTTAKGQQIANSHTYIQMYIVAHFTTPGKKPPPEREVMPRILIRRE